MMILNLTFKWRHLVLQPVQHVAIHYFPATTNRTASLIALTANAWKSSLLLEENTGQPSTIQQIVPSKKALNGWNIIATWNWHRSLLMRVL